MYIAKTTLNIDNPTNVIYNDTKQALKRTSYSLDFYKQYKKDFVFCQVQDWVKLIQKTN